MDHLRLVEEVDAVDDSEIITCFVHVSIIAAIKSDQNPLISNLGSLDNMSLRTPGPTLAPHPPAAVISVSLIFQCHRHGTAKISFVISHYPFLLLLNLVKSYSGNNHNALQNSYTLLASESSYCFKMMSISSSVLNGPPRI